MSIDRFARPVRASNLSRQSGNPNPGGPSFDLQTEEAASVRPPRLFGKFVLGSLISARDLDAWAFGPTQFTYVWNRDGTPIALATGEEYTIVQADVGTVLTCDVTAANFLGPEAPVAVTSEESPEVTEAAAPVNTVAPAITGTAKVGEVLTCSNGTWDNTPTSYSRIWYADGIVIDGETGATYTALHADIDALISCQVTAVNSFGSTGALTAETGAVVTNLPVNSVVPAITGTAQVGQVLTCSDGTWSNTPLTYPRVWYAGGVVIVGEVLATYTALIGDIGKVITCKVTATNAIGATDFPITTAPTAAVIAA